jgi:hypothetical protein
MQLDWDFVADQFQQYADTDPVHWNSTEGCIHFAGVPVFYQRHDDHFILEADGCEVEIPRI